MLKAHLSFLIKLECFEEKLAKLEDKAKILILNSNDQLTISVYVSS